MGQQILPEYSSKFSRKDYTLSQLFACLVLREHQKKSYRGVCALLEDSPQWRAEIGLKSTPDHNTLCRAFHFLLRPGRVKSMLDLQAQWGQELGLTHCQVKPLALDSSMFESHHVSRHFEKRQKETAKKNKQQKRKNKARKAQKANRSRSKKIKRLPKLSLAVASVSHLILAARATTGGGGDQPFFKPLLLDARRRAKIKVAVADAGYDSEPNHRTARLDLGVRSIIPPRVGRPSDKPATAHFRRLMQQRFARKADGKYYGQRWQAETVNSMIKRNLGSALRACTARARGKELLLRMLTHNIMILTNAEG